MLTRDVLPALPPIFFSAVLGNSLLTECSIRARHHTVTSFTEVCLVVRACIINNSPYLRNQAFGDYTFDDIVTFLAGALRPDLLE